jgi:pyridoxine/pyridoxamine 5'-phosphate oxidase
MNTGVDTEALAARLLADNMYMTLATADEEGRPWVSPVWFAPLDDDHLLWVSSPERRHSRNIAARPEIAIVVFDSTVPVGSAEALYLEATAGQVGDAELERGTDAFTRRSEQCGAGTWGAADVRSPARFRLYRAEILARYVLGPGDDRLPVRPQGSEQG